MNHKPVSHTSQIEQPHSKLESEQVPEEDEENHGGADEVGQEFEPLGSQEKERTHSITSYSSLQP